MSTFSGTKAIALKNYCIPIYNGNLYFLAKLFEGDITTRYAISWKISMLCHHHDFAKNITQQKRSLGNDANVSI